MTPTRSRAADAMVSAGSLCTLAAGTSIISPEVRAAIANVIAGDPAGHVSALASRALEFAHTLSGVAGDYRLDNTPLVGFGVVAVVLTVMMCRT
jgi:hypothetical protein